MKRIDKILILGGGSAGFLASLAIKGRNPAIEVTVLRSKDIGIIGVGEGSTFTLSDFLHKYLRVPPELFFGVARPTWKLGLRFIWGKRPFFHYSFGGQLDGRPPELRHAYGYYCNEEMSDWDTYDALMNQDRVFVRKPDGRPDLHRDLSYHFENEKFVEFLEKYALMIGVKIIEDTVREVEQDEGGVRALKLASGNSVSADLFVDSSGFVSLLLGKTLGEPFESFATSLFCDRAVVGGWARTDEVIRPYTTCETMNSGWCWQIEHENRINRGYVYSSGFISDEEAEREFRAKSPKVGPTRIVNFVSGRYRRSFIKNVVAIGNASGFVEPLEATALGVICIQSRLVSDMLIDSDRTLRPTQVAQFNDHHARYWDGIRGCIAMHYKYNDRIETEFWRYCREKTELGVAGPVVEYFQEHGPCAFWGPTLMSSFDAFKSGGYTTLLTGMRIPYQRRYTPTALELELMQQRRERNKAAARDALTVKEALEMIHSPEWSWS